MALVLQQIRFCDGACCVEMPRFPVDATKRGDARGGCKYFDAELAHTEPNYGKYCRVMADPAVKAALSTIASAENYKSLSDLEYFNQTCPDWPQKGSTAKLGDTGKCCWQYVDDGA